MIEWGWGAESGVGGAQGVPKLGLGDPKGLKMGMGDPKMGLEDPKAGLEDPKMGLGDPKMGLGDLRGSQIGSGGSQRTLKWG